MKSLPPPADSSKDSQGNADGGDFGAPQFRLVRLRPGTRFRTYRWLPVGIAIATLLVLVAVFSGTVEATDSTLVQMGFDPDRAQLITALLIASITSGAVSLVVDRPGFAALLGVGSLVAIFAQTFAAETQNAATATGAFGSFDLGGWGRTLGTLLLIGYVVAWAGSTLATALRPGLIGSAIAVGEMVKARRPSRRLARRPLLAALVTAALVFAAPGFGDMVNISPDVLMLGGANGPGLAPGNSIPNFGPTLGAFATPTPAPTTGRNSPTPDLSPWKAWRPSGKGRMVYLALPSPWKNAGGATEEVAVYLPPGYDVSGTQRYPTGYEASQLFSLWNSGIHVQAALDALIVGGSIPAGIYVFVHTWGGPYDDSECANSADSQEWMDTFLSVTVPAWIDSHYRTIATAAARSVFGMSEGGYCAAMLALRHPDVFGSELSFSGYYVAGSASAVAQLPFGNSAASIAQYSPLALAQGQATNVADSLYFVLVFDPGQDFYGPQATAFARILADNGYSYKVIDSTLGHGWAQVRGEFARALALIATRQAQMGAFS